VDCLFTMVPSDLRTKLVKFKYDAEMSSIKLFMDSDNDFASHLMINSKPYVIKKGQIIYGHGDISSEISFLIRGTVAIVTVYGKMEQIVGYSISGGYLGDFEYYKKGLRRNEYRATQSCSLLSVSFACLDAAIHDHPVAGMKFISQLKERHQTRTMITL
jgi:CRP-like cAMP-binding protein